MTTIATTKDAIVAARTRMEKAIDDFRKETTSLRTGRANAMLLDNVREDLARVVQTALEPAHVSVWTSRRE